MTKTVFFLSIPVASVTVAPMDRDKTVFMLRGNFTQVSNHILRGGHGIANIAVLSTIMSHGKCWASAATITKEVGCDRHTVFKVIQYWENLGVLNVSRKHGQTSVITTSGENSTGTSVENHTTPVGKTPHKEYPPKKNIEEDGRRYISSNPRSIRELLEEGRLKAREGLALRD